MQPSFIQLIQSRAARISVGPSAVRGKGHGGVTRAARSHLKSVDLRRFGTKNGNKFKAALDEETEKLRRALPEGAQKWGLARKVLNIFLRDCAYTGFLAEAFDLQRAQHYFEIPLDSITASELRRASGRGGLPCWPGVKYVTPQLNAEYQRAAAAEAEKRRIARLHLDALWWAYSRDEPEVQ